MVDSPVVDLCETDAESVTSEKQTDVSYTLKIINKIGTEIRKWEVDEKFTDIDQLKTQLSEDIECYESDKFLLGYIEPGHATKGRQLTLENTDDLVMMYKAHKGRKHIVLWIKCDRKSKKRQLSTVCHDADGDANANSIKRPCPSTKADDTKSKYTHNKGE